MTGSKSASPATEADREARRGERPGGLAHAEAKPDTDKAQEFVLFADINDDEASKQWLVENLLGAGEASAFVGKPGDGKSVLVEDLALHVAAGWPWHNRAVSCGVVLFVALERPKLVRRRALAFRRHHGIEELPFAVTDGGFYDFRNVQATAEQIARLGGKSRRRQVRS